MKVGYNHRHSAGVGQGFWQSSQFGNQEFNQQSATVDSIGSRRSQSAIGKGGTRHRALVNPQCLLNR
jgi:hypothetical protein